MRTRSVHERSVSATESPGPHRRPARRRRVPRSTAAPDRLHESPQRIVAPGGEHADRERRTCSPARSARRVQLRAQVAHDTRTQERGLPDPARAVEKRQARGPEVPGDDSRLAVATEEERRVVLAVGHEPDERRLGRRRRRSRGRRSCRRAGREDLLLEPSDVLVERDVEEVDVTAVSPERLLDLRTPRRSGERAAPPTTSGRDAPRSRSD